MQNCDFSKTHDILILCIKKVEKIDILKRTLQTYPQLIGFLYSFPYFINGNSSQRQPHNHRLLQNKYVFLVSTYVCISFERETSDKCRGL